MRKSYQLSVFDVMLYDNINILISTVLYEQWLHLVLRNVACYLVHLFVYRDRNILPK